MSIDRYVYPGTGVLVNRFGIADGAKLAMLERAVTSADMLGLIQDGITGMFDIDHIRSIHSRIFSGVYDWAGEFRDIEIMKGGTEFVAPEGIGYELEDLCGTIRGAGYFLGLDRGRTADALAGVICGLNQIHPFREGNGRTQRIFVSQLALNAGYDLDFAGVTENDMRNASMAAARGNRNLMKFLFLNALSERIYDPGPIRAGAVPEPERKPGFMGRLFGKLSGKK